MKFLEAVKLMSADNKEVLNDILFVLQDRREAVELMEPMSDGYYYEKWEEKLSELESIIETLENILDIDIIYEKDVQQLQSSIMFYQLNYGGLKRLKI